MKNYILSYYENGESEHRTSVMLSYADELTEAQIKKDMKRLCNSPYMHDPIIVKI